MAGLALLLSHDAVFLAHVGPGEELTRRLREAGHDYWGWASLLLAVVGFGAGAVSVVRLRSLRRHAAQLPAAPTEPPPAARSQFGAIWPRLFAIVVVAFVLQENVEHVISHGHAIGLGALLGPEYPLALPVIGLITALASFVAAAVRRTECALLATISAVLRRPVRPPRLDFPRLQPVLPRLSPLANSIAGRAPPRVFVLRY